MGAREDHTLDGSCPYCLNPYTRPIIEPNTGIEVAEQDHWCSYFNLENVIRKRRKTEAVEKLRSELLYHVIASSIATNFRIKFAIDLGKKGIIEVVNNVITGG